MASSCPFTAMSNYLTEYSKSYSQAEPGNHPRNVDLVATLSVLYII